MEIDAPSHAVAVWLEGDAIMVRFPDRQVVAMQSPIQLMIVLKHREDATKRRRPMTVGTEAAPVQYDIDTVAASLKSAPINGHKNWDDNVREAGERIRAKNETKKRRLITKDNKRLARKEAEALLSSIGL